MTFYPSELTAKSRGFFAELAEQFSDGSCTLIGGWAVNALTSDEYQEESRDIDLIFHTAEAFAWFETTFMRKHGLAWSGKRRKFNCCYIKDERPPRIIVDVFASTKDALTRRFAVEDQLLIKRYSSGTWLPSVQWLVREKLTVLPKRRRQDNGQKAFKDTIDAWALVFHNTSGDLPDELRQTIPDGIVARALDYADELRAYASEHGVYEEELETLLDWLLDK